MKAVAAALALVASLVPAAAQAPPQGYKPGLGDLMTTTVQPRHIKLALAGREKNWIYAAYELHELQEAFERASAVWPTWQSVPVAQMIAAITKDPIAALGDAIKARDQGKFDAAYKQLTEACNTCHQAADRGMVAIQVPAQSSFPDQDFRPQQ